MPSIIFANAVLANLETSILKTLYGKRNHGVLAWGRGKGEVMGTGKGRVRNGGREEEKEWGREFAGAIGCFAGA